MSHHDSSHELDEAAAHQRRRERIENEAVEQFCSECYSIAFPAEDRCAHCHQPRPDDGWPALIKAGDPWLGRVLGDRYLITGLLGKGANATVYRAASLSINRFFAIKVIATESSSDGSERSLSRVHNEIAALSQMRNPHIVSVYEILALDRDHTGAVMNLITGTTLQQLVDTRGPQTIERACSLLRQVANGLFEAHQAGMVHRDLKPENLMVERLPAGEDFVHILDFGIVRLKSKSRQSMTQGFVGTPLFASPEQVRAGELDGRSDIYSLGAVLFFLLTGSAPFPDENIFDVLQHHLTTPAPRLSDFQSQRSFPAELEDLVARMLAKQPSHRPQDLSQVIAELDQVLDGLRPGAAPASQTSETLEANPAPALGAPSSAAATHDPYESTERSHSGVLRRAAIPDEPAFYELDVSASMTRATFSPRGAFALLEGAGQAAQIFHPGETTPTQLDMSIKNPVTAISLSNTSLFAGHEDGAVTRTEIGSFDTRVLFEDPQQRQITSLDVDHEETTIVAATQEGSVYLDRPETPNATPWKLLRQGSPVRCLALNLAMDATLLATDDNFLEILGFSDHALPAEPFLLPQPVRAISCSPDGYLMAASMANGGAGLFEIPTGRQLLMVSAEGADVLAVDFADDATPMAIVAIERQVRLMEFSELQDLAG